MVEEVLEKAQLGMTREEIKAVLGEPDDWSRGTRKYPVPAIYKYGDLELHFFPWKNGTLWMIYSEDDQGEPTIHKKL